MNCPSCTSLETEKRAKKLIPVVSVLTHLLEKGSRVVTKINSERIAGRLKRMACGFHRWFAIRSITRD